MDDRDLLAKLTEREKICLRKWLERKSAKEIAAELHISHHAVEKRLKMARTKLGATSSLEAARMLGEEEGYGRAVAQTPDLASPYHSPETAADRFLIFGAIAMGIFAVAVLAVMMHSAGHSVATQQPGVLAREHDDQLDSTLSALIASAEIGPDGDIFLNHPVGEPRYLEPRSGRYWQINCPGQRAFPSRSLETRRLDIRSREPRAEPLHYNSDRFAEEPLRVAERTARLPKSDIECTFVVARARDEVP